MTHIVGDGHALLSERVRLKSLKGGASLNELASSNPFVGGDGLRWDDATFALKGGVAAGAHHLAPTSASTIVTLPAMRRLPKRGGVGISDTRV
jgi:hypothetical protein